MSRPDVDEVLNFLSIKFNKIFCDRDFVCCVIEDFQTILNNKNKTCVLVFPTLGPIYLKALRYQARIFDLAVFNITSASGKFKSIAVCHKDHLKKTTKEEVMPESILKRKRPERQLYVPPAQRVSRLKSRQKKVSETCDCVFSLSDLVNLTYFFNLPCEFRFTPDLYQHHNCEFRKFLKFRENDPLKFECFIKIYDNLILLKNVCWRLNQLQFELQKDYTFSSYPVFDFDNLSKYIDGLPVTAEKPSALLVNNDMNDFKILDDSQNDIYKIECDTCCDESEILDLSMIELGHFCIVSVENCDYLHECQDNHNATICCENVRKHLARKQVVNVCAIENENETTNKPIEKNGTNPENGTHQSNKECVKNQINKKVSDNKHEQEKEIMRMTKEYINRKTRPIMKYVDDSNNTLRIDKNDSVNNWEDLFDDDGHIQDNLLTEIVDKVGDDITIVKATEDYTEYTNKPPEDLEHIVELYNFPPTLETHDLVQAFSEIKSDAMYIKWVDDTHALLVLGSLSQAQKAMNMRNPLIKVRPMTAASALAMDVANNSDLKPAMQRPPTNLQTARRLITTHLGTKSKLSKEQIAKEKQDLKAAREKKRMLKQNEKDAWEGNLRSSMN